MTGSLPAITGVDAGQLGVRVAIVVATVLVTLAVLKVASFLVGFLRIQHGLSKTTVPRAPGYNWLLGHVIPLITCVGRGKGAWDVMEEWIKERGPIVQFRILTTQGIAICDPASLKRIFQTGYKLYNKDLDLSYKPFLPILGSGLVTADGDLWQKQRLLIGPALRTDILDDIVPIARSATQRLIKKIEVHRGSGKAVDMQKEFHLLTLQVIGEAVLSLAPEECDRVCPVHACVMQVTRQPMAWPTLYLPLHHTPQVFPQLYLPVMEEANRRVLRPYRSYLPILPEWWRFRSRMAKLNNFLITYFRCVPGSCGPRQH